ncbi:MAG: putative DNA binding domain-containing protein [Prevotellaceae bacterium]|jgi:ATP-dependent DNA helicase RecG|nr:putative DNA binding domain-containing protein [Prevotellaceae bacterium]
MLTENQVLEFKSGFNDEVIETLTAFANARGGRVLVGVNNDGNPVKGFRVGNESIQKWLNEIKNKTKPSIIPDVEVVTYKNSDVLSFSIKEFPVKPVAFRGRYFRRINNANHLLSAPEISDVYLQSMQYSWDAYPYFGADTESLNPEKIKSFIARVNATGRFHLPENPVEALYKLRMLKDGKPTNAAMILFSRENLLHNVHIGRFKTPSLILADKMINGNLYDVAEEAMQTIISHLKFAFEITGKTTQRTEIPEYPLDAIRELLLNALIHRDYKSSTDIQIKIFDQQITFFNPGGLYGDLTEDELKTDAYSASTRNKQLAEAFYLTHDIEKYGSGFIRIRKLITNYPTMTFSFHNRGDGFVSELHYTLQKDSTKGDTIFDWQKRLINNKGVNPESEGVNLESEGVNRLFELIKIYPGKRIPFFESELNIPQKTIERWIKKLRNEHKIIYTGSSKTGGYYVLI